MKNGPKISPTELEFRTEEYKSLRSEIVVLYGLTFQIERNAIAAIAIIYGYLLSDKIVDSQIAIGFWVFPPLIALYAILRLHLFYRGMVNLGDFIATEIEGKLLISGNGWETSLRKNQPVISNNLYKFFNRGGPVGIWIVIFSTSIGVTIAKWLGFF